MDPALKRAEDMDEFLTKLLREVVTHGEFKRLYIGNAGDVELELTRLLTALRVNREQLANGLTELERFPNDLILQSNVNGFRRGLEATLSQAQNYWNKLREELDNSAAELSGKVEAGEMQPVEKEKSASGKLLTSLKNVREFLSVSVDIKEAALKLLPVVLALKEVLHWLKFLR